MSTASRVWLISGCSSGFGRALAEAALERGESVLATARRPESLAALTDRFGARVRTRALDVTQPEQVHAVVQEARDCFGRLDVLVNNAGYGMQGAIEDVPEDEARKLFETNVFGVLSLTRAALPLMRAQRSGHIVNISSVGGRTSAPLIGLYSATKFAVEGLSVALSAELAPHGIRVTVVEPGAFATQFATAVRSVTPSAAYAALDAQLSAVLKSLKWGDPQDAARAILEALDAPEPPRRLVLGEHALAMVRQTLAEQLAELERWQRLSARAAPA